MAINTWPISYLGMKRVHDFVSLCNEMKIITNFKKPEVIKNQKKKDFAGYAKIETIKNYILGRVGA